MGSLFVMYLQHCNTPCNFCSSPKHHKIDIPTCIPLQLAAEKVETEEQHRLAEVADAQSQLLREIASVDGKLYTVNASLLASREELQVKHVTFKMNIAILQMSRSKLFYSQINDISQAY